MRVFLSSLAITTTALFMFIACPPTGQVTDDDSATPEPTPNPTPPVFSVQVLDGYNEISLFTVDVGGGFLVDFTRTETVQNIAGEDHILLLRGYSQLAAANGTTANGDATFGLILDGLPFEILQTPLALTYEEANDAVLLGPPGQEAVYSLDWDGTTATFTFDETDVRNPPGYDGPQVVALTPKPLPNSELTGTWNYQSLTLDPLTYHNICTPLDAVNAALLRGNIDFADTLAFSHSTTVEVYANQLCNGAPIDGFVGDGIGLFDIDEVAKTITVWQLMNPGTASQFGQRLMATYSMGAGVLTIDRTDLISSDPGAPDMSQIVLTGPN